MDLKKKIGDTNWIIWIFKRNICIENIRKEIRGENPNNTNILLTNDMNNLIVLFIFRSKFKLFFSIHIFIFFDKGF